MRSLLAHPYAVALIHVLAYSTTRRPAIGSTFSPPLTVTEKGFSLPEQFPTPQRIEQLAFLSDRVTKIASIDPALSASERTSLLLAAQMINQVREGKLSRLAAAN
jgi:hypothetical protein